MQDSTPGVYAQAIAWYPIFVFFLRLGLAISLSCAILSNRNIDLILRSLLLPNGNT